MSKKQIKITENDLKNIISESVKNILIQEEENNYSIVHDYDRLKREITDETSEDYDSDTAFEYEIMDMIYEAQRLFEGIKQYLEESDGLYSDKEYILKKIEKINNICDLIYSFWDE